jgi:hypothetical protein
MEQIFRLLNQDLRDRAGLDLSQVLKVEGTIAWGINPARGEGTIALSWGAGGWQLRLPLKLAGTWTGSTVHLLVQVILARLKSRSRPPPPGTLTINFSE